MAQAKIVSPAETAPTEAMLAALKWLRKRNGDGGFTERNNRSVLIAGGERAPIMRSTWTRLEKAGFVHRYSKFRLCVTEAGRAVDVSGVTESQPF